MFKQKQLEVANVYNLMIHASRHVLINLVNQMRLFETEALNSKDFDRDVVNLYGNARKKKQPI